MKDGGRVREGDGWGGRREGGNGEKERERERERERGRQREKQKVCKLATCLHIQDNYFLTKTITTSKNNSTALKIIKFAPALVCR